MNKEKFIAMLDKVIEWSLYLLIFCVPFSKSMIEICITVGFISWLCKKILLKDYSLKKTPINSALIAFLVVCALSIINADFKLMALKALVSKCFKYVLLYFIVVETINTKVKLKNVLTMALISCTVVVIDSYLQYFVLHKDLFRLYPSFKYAPLTNPNLNYLGAPTGPFPFPNDLAAWMLVFLVPFICLLIWGKMRFVFRLLLGAFTSSFVLLFYYTNARSAWLGFFGSFFLIVFVQSKKLFIVLLVGLLVLGAILGLFLPQEKIDDIFGISSLHDRAYMWRIGWKVFTEHPILGNGINMFFGKFRQFREDEYTGKLGSHAHNGFLQIAAEIGIIGLLAFITFIIGAFTSTINFIKRSKNSFYRVFSLGLMGGLFAFLIHSFFDTNLQSLPLAALFWYGISILMSLGGIADENV